MVRDDFDDSSERLEEQSDKPAGTEQSADNLDEVVAQRIDVDHALAETGREHTTIGPRSEPSAADVGGADIASSNVAPIGKIAAGISVVLIAIGLFFAVKAFQNFTAQFPLVYVDVDEFMAPQTCEWTVRATLRNDSDRTVEVQRMFTVLDRRGATAKPTAYPTLEPGNTAVATGVFTLRNVDVCPAVADINHTNLSIRLDDGTEVSRSFDS